MKITFEITAADVRDLDPNVSVVDAERFLRDNATEVYERLRTISREILRSILVNQSSI